MGSVKSAVIKIKTRVWLLHFAETFVLHRCDFFFMIGTSQESPSSPNRTRTNDPLSVRSGAKQQDNRKSSGQCRENSEKPGRLEQESVNSHQ